MRTKAEKRATALRNLAKARKAKAAKRAARKNPLLTPGLNDDIFNAQYTNDPSSNTRQRMVVEVMRWWTECP